MTDFKRPSSLPSQGFQFSYHPVSLTYHPVLEPNEIAALRQLKLKFLVYHGKYVYNFCRENVESQIESLVKEIELATQLGCDVIIHQGKNVESANQTKLAAVNNYVRNLSEVIDRTSDSTAKILLENSAGQGSELGSTLEELTYIYNQFDDTAKERLGFCLDTCHAFVAGEIDLRQPASIQRFITQFEQQIGREKLGCIHFNDSAVPFGGRHDNHSDWMGGFITNPLLGGSTEGAQWFAQWAHEYQVPLIFETPCTLPGTHELQSHLLRNWIDQSPLTTDQSNLIQVIETITAESLTSKRNKRKTQS